MKIRTIRDAKIGPASLAVGMTAPTATRVPVNRMKPPRTSSAPTTMGPERRRLTGPVPAQKPKGCPGIHVEGQVADHRLVAEVHPEIPDAHQWLAHHVVLVHGITIDPGFPATETSQSRPTMPFSWGGARTWMASARCSVGRVQDRSLASLTPVAA